MGMLARLTKNGDFFQFPIYSIDSILGETVFWLRAGIKQNLVWKGCLRSVGDALHGFQNYVSFKPSTIVNFLFRLGQRGISEYSESTRKYESFLREYFAYVCLDNVEMIYLLFSESTWK